MMPLKKTIVILVSLSMFSTLFLSGCIFQDLIFGTSFNLKSWSLSDDDGFPAVSYSYTSSGYVTVKMYNSTSSLVDSDIYIQGDGEKTLFLGSYRETLPSGSYVLKTFDKNGNQIFSKKFKFKGMDVDIFSCDQRWWINANTKILLGLRLGLRNTGDVPVYPHSIELETDSETISGLVLPECVLPGDIEYVDCVLYKNDQPTDDDFNLILKDIDGLFLTSNVFSFDVSNSVTTKYFTEGVEKKLSVPYPDFLFSYYSNLDRVTDEDYSYYVFDPYDDYYLDIFIDRLISTLPFGEKKFNTYSDPEKINFISRIVQYLDYKEDTSYSNTSEYPNYPIETLFNRVIGCDCEDKAILTASLLDRLGYNVALIRLPNHMAVGVNLSNDAISHYSYYKDGYYYLETTMEESPIGFVPSQYTTSSESEIYPVSSRPYIRHTWVNNVFTIFTKMDAGDFVKLDAIVENNGRSTAYNVKVEGAFVTMMNLTIQSDDYVISSLKPGKKQKVTLTISIPQTVLTTFKSRIYLNGKLVDFKESSEPFP